MSSRSPSRPILLCALLFVLASRAAVAQEGSRHRSRRSARLPSAAEVARRQALDDLVHAYTSPDLHLGDGRPPSGGRRDERLGDAYLWLEGPVYVLEIPGHGEGESLLLMRGTRYGDMDTFVGTMTVLRIFTSVGELGAWPSNWMPYLRWASYENHFRFFTANVSEDTRISFMAGPRVRVINWVETMNTLSQITLEPGIELDHAVTPEFGFTLRVVGGPGATLFDGAPTSEAGAVNAVLELHLP